MAQTYRDPLAHQRMAADTCPECGQPAAEHSSSPYFWERSFDRCNLLPHGVRERIDQYRADTEEAAVTICGHCGCPPRGHAAVNGTPLCHPDTGPDCYRLVTVYHHPMPCPDCPGRHDNQSLRAFDDLLTPQIRSVDTPDGVRHYDDTGREYTAVYVDGELTYTPTVEQPS